MAFLLAHRQLGGFKDRPGFRHDCRTALDLCPHTLLSKQAWAPPKKVREALLVCVIPDELTNLSESFNTEGVLGTSTSYTQDLGAKP